jgi:hypothetical protein
MKHINFLESDTVTVLTSNFYRGDFDDNHVDIYAHIKPQLVRVSKAVISRPKRAINTFPKTRVKVWKKRQPRTNWLRLSFMVLFAGAVCACALADKNILLYLFQILLS